MKRSGCDRPANCMQGADHACIPASSELVLRIEAQGVETLAKQALPLAVLLPQPVYSVQSHGIQWEEASQMCITNLVCSVVLCIEQCVRNREEREDP